MASYKTSWTFSDKASFKIDVKDFLNLNKCLFAWKITSLKNTYTPISAITTCNVKFRKHQNVVNDIKECFSRNLIVWIERILGKMSSNFLFKFKKTGIHNESPMQPIPGHCIPPHPFMVTVVYCLSRRENFSLVAHTQKNVCRAQS